MIPNWYTLNISTENAMNPFWEFPKLTAPRNTRIWTLQPTWVLNEQWLKNLSINGFDVDSVQLFFRPRGQNLRHAHIDGQNSTGHKLGSFGLNFVIAGARNSNMIWYSMPESDHDDPARQDTYSNAAYSHWPIKDLTEVDRCELVNELTIVNVSVPHRVVVTGADRWALSLRTTPATKSLSWEKVVEYCKDRNILIERQL